jgi:hypothetical protein
MNVQYDFSKGERGKFYREEAILNIPIYLDPDVEEAMQSLTQTTDQNLGKLVNDWLRNNIEMIRSVQPLPKP